MVRALAVNQELERRPRTQNLSILDKATVSTTTTATRMKIRIKTRLNLTPSLLKLPGVSHLMRHNLEGHFRANMTVIEKKRKFASSVAKLGDDKSPNMLINSGGTHNFFHFMSSFSNYERIGTETVRVSFIKTNITGKVLVWDPLNGGVQMNGHHTPQFTSNILSVRELNDHFDVLFSSAIQSKKGCFIFKQRTRSVIFDTLC